MARDIYSFVKVHKDQTNRGIYCTIAGIATIVCLSILIAMSFAGGGTLPLAAGAVGYLSLVISLWALHDSYHLRNDPEAYGSMVESAFYVCLVSALYHAVVFLVGCFAAIL